MKNERPFHRNASPKIFENARALKREMTIAEKLLWKQLKSRKLKNLKFRRQHPIDKFIVDFYCHEFKLIIEIDGSVHEIAEVKEHDVGREFELIQMGYRILRFTNEMVIDSIENVLEEIQKSTCRV